MKPERLKVAKHNSSKLYSTENNESVCYLYTGNQEGEIYTLDRNIKLRRAKEIEMNSNLMADLYDKIKDEQGELEFGTLLKQRFPELFNYLNNEL